MHPKNARIESLLGSGKRLQGIFTPPPDKSVTHRAIFLASLSTKKSRVQNPLLAGDCLSTLRAFQKLGVPIRVAAGWGEIVVPAEKNPRSHFRRFRPPAGALDCGNSGTTMRLLAGVLAAQPFPSKLTGDRSLSQRPMNRVIEPLTQMGARIIAAKGGTAPLILKSNPFLKPISYTSPIASAQVKSCVLLSGLCAEGKTTVQEPFQSRDHTERMLKSVGVKIEFDARAPLQSKNKVAVWGKAKLDGLDLRVPGDFSSAAFFIAAALITPNSEILIRDVNLNPTRTGLLNVLKRMGAGIKVENLRVLCGEPIGDLEVRHSFLKATAIGENEIPALIDEVPILSVLATQAEGVTVISGAGELRRKESDRLSAIASELQKMGANIKQKKDGLIIAGPKQLWGATLNSFHDHRMAMALSMAGLNAKGTNTIKNFNCVQISFPKFSQELQRLIN